MSGLTTMDCPRIQLIRWPVVKLQGIGGVAGQGVGEDQLVASRLVVEEVVDALNDYYDVMTPYLMHFVCVRRMIGKDKSLMKYYELKNLSVHDAYGLDVNDFNISKLTPASDTQGGVELSVYYIFKKKKTFKRQDVPCPIW